MKKQLLLLALLFCTQLTLFSQYSISGKVNDENGNPMPGANVVLRETFSGQTTNKEGEFSLKKIKSGTYTISVSFLGYETENKTINLDKDINLMFELNPKSYLADEVIVLSTRASDKDPVTHSTVTRDDYQNQNLGQDLPILLNLIPSVVTTSDAGTGIGYTGMRIRGSDAEKINVTINGVPFNDAESHGVYWVDIPDIASSTQSIQVQRGVGTSTNGSGAFGASINLNTDSISRKPFSKVTVSGGSFNTQKGSLSLGTGLINNHWFLEGRASSSKSDGYIDRGWSNLKSYFAQAGYYSEKTIIKLVAFGGLEETYQAWYGLDSASMQQYGRRFNWAGTYFEHDTMKFYDKFIDHYQQDNIQFHLVHKISSDLKFNLAVHYTYGRGYYQEFQQNQDLNFYGAPYHISNGDTTKTTDLVRRLWLDNNFYGGVWGLTYTNNGLSIVWGGAVNKYANARHFGDVIWSRDFSTDLLGKQFYNNVGNKLEFNSYLKAAYAITEPLTLYADVQGRGINYTASGTNKEYTDQTIDISKQYRFFNPKVGLFYQLNNHTSTYLSYSIANREPTRTDLIEAAAGETVNPETLRDLEIGIKHNSTLVYTELVLYNMNYINQLVLTGEVNSVGNPIRKNVGRSNRLGGELVAGIKPCRFFKFEGNVTLSRNKTDYTNSGSTKKVDISYSPKMIAGYKISVMPVEETEIALLGKYVGKQYLDNTQNETLRLDPYFVNDLLLGYHHTFSLFGNVGLYLKINNIFNVLYNSNANESGGIPYYFPQATRNFLVGLSVSL
jgi:iron complex outermembrane receptor protein